ncbi:CinA family protein [Oryzobacter terrae]|uniref:CinA family protein n=1 Tax=Oryzobacter terrae TaxID=1620385 RepID=UPI00367100AD
MTTTHDEATTTGTEGVDADAAQVARLALARGWSVGTAESLTSGSVASVLGAAPDAASWFRGSVVAYAREVKFHLLGVPRGPVVSEAAAVSMARGARRELRADVVVSTTGAGGPQSEDGQPPGTVWLAVAWPGGRHAEEHHLPGDPAEVVAGATALSVRMLRAALEEEAG